MRYRLSVFIFCVIASTVTAITLDSVIAFSDSCVNIQWTPDSVNTDPAWYFQYGSLCINDNSIYKQCDFIPGREYRGVAYSYGGEDPWFLFRDRLQNGFLVGSHQCHYNLYGDPSNKVTGTDCSGFLSFVWNVPRVSTSIFYTSTSYTTIPFSEIRAGDALIKASSTCGYHAILIVEAQDLTEVVVSEASSTVLGCRERIVDLTSSAWSCYKAIRHPGLKYSESKNIYNSSLSSTLEYSVKVNPKVLQLNMEQSFTGTVTGYLPNGNILFCKSVVNPTSIITIERTAIQSNIIIMSLFSSTQQSMTSKTIVVQ